MADISFECPHCKQVLEAPATMGGEAVECPSCQKQIQVPQAEDSESGDAAVAADEAADAAEEAQPEAEAPAQCPACHAPMEAEAVLCIKCGYHTKLGKKIETTCG